jgi:glycosyltransferase involved in cell wall biosynthesis
MDKQFGLNYDEEFSHKISAINAVYKNLSLQNPSVLQHISLISESMYILKKIAKRIPFINFLKIKFKQLERIRKIKWENVTIVITTYNQPKRLIEICINSVLSQTYVNFKLIIIDDGSTNDDTINYLNEIKNDSDPRISIYFKKNSGVIEARNLGIKYCRTKYIVFLDPDDSIEITYLEKCFLLINSYKNISVVSTDVLVTTQEKNYIWETTEISHESLLVHNSLPITSLIKLKDLKRVGGFSNHMRSGYEDWELWVKFSKRGFRSVKLDEPLFKHSFSDSSGRDYQARKIHSILKSKLQVNNFSVVSSPSQISRSPLYGFELSLPYILGNSGHSTVFIFVPWLTKHGGVEYFLRTFTEKLVQQKKTVVFVSTHDNYARDSQQYLDVTPYVYELPKFLMQGNYIHFVKNLLSRCTNPVIFNCGSTWLYNNLEEIVESQNGVLRVYDVLFNQLGHLPNFLRYQNLFHGVIPVYQRLGKLLMDDFKVKTKVTTIPIGIQPLKELQPKRSTSKPQIGWLGRLSEEKRPNWFMQLASDSNLEADFLLAGSGSLEKELRESIHKTPNLKMLGEIENQFHFISSLDLMINTSSIEGISVAAMEAIQLGVPVIASRVGGMSELIKDGQNGYLYNPDDFYSLLSIIRNILKTPGLLNSLQKTTKKLGLPNQFKLESSISSFIKLLN